ncbi:MAG: hypothetical protein PHW82_00685 [Bacteroidales bacterium]|nr:hypothetical protein [Bacteroidales bacterium]
MKKIQTFYFAILFLLFSSNIIFAQRLLKSQNPNQFEVCLYNGVVKSQFNSLNGVDKPDNAPGLNHGLSISYNRFITKQLSFSAGWGFGFQAFNYSVADKHGFTCNENWQYWHKVYYNIYHKAEIKANYYLQLNKNDKLKFGIGGGASQFFNTGFGTSSVNQEGISEYYFEVEYPAQINPVAIISIDFVKPLKNMNDFEAGLSYTHGFNNIYEGNYQLYNNASNGELSSNGSHFGVNLAYVFTGNDKKQKLNNRIAAGEDAKKAKKDLRIARRYLDPKSTFVNIHAGTFITVNKVNDPEGQLGRSRMPSFSGGAQYEHGIDNNFVITGAYHFSEYYNARRYVFMSGTSGSNAFWTHEFSAGAAYRWITPSNLKIANFYIGLSSGFCIAELGQSGAFSGSMSSWHNINSEPEFTIDITGTNKIKSRLILSTYIGVSKDFRLTDFFWLSLNYRYQHGFNTLQQTHIEYTTNKIVNPVKATSYIDGTGHQISFGIKLRFR